MNKKGFTLIELLAVIVILAIIALIATPIILGIINDAREESNERSAELYASAVRNAIASYQLTHPTAPTKFSDLNVQYDGEIECETEELYKDGSFYIADCTVNETTVEYTYGRKKYEPQYYYFGYDFYGFVGDADILAESERLTVPPTGEIRYLGYDLEDGKISAAYACFVRNNTEYCLKGYDTEAFATNNTILEEAFGASDCSFSDDGSNCSADGLYFFAYSDGGVGAGDVDSGDGTAICSVYGSDSDDPGYFGCIQ